MDIEQEINTKQSSFFITSNGTRVAEIVFHIKDDKTMVIDHTEVSEELAGKGIGAKLVTQAVEYAREQNLSVIPSCTYAKRLFDKKGAEWKDVLKK